MFYSLIQNKVGGLYFTNDRICREMIIEADNADEAAARAEMFGCYFDGVDKGYDSGRDGDRWELDKITEIKYSESQDDLAQYIEKNVGDDTCPDIRVFYAEGVVKEYYKEQERTPASLSSKIEVSSDVHIGDVFYRVVKVDTQIFSEPCPQCHDTKKIQLWGGEYECPVCKRMSSVSCVAGLYAVLRYRVYSLAEEMSTDFWKPDSYRINKISLFHRIGKGDAGSEFTKTTERFSEFIRLLDKPERFIRSENYGTNGFFSDYKLACQYAEKLNAEEDEKIEKFNAAHGSNHKLDRSKRENDKQCK